jgi:hypothetical protein
LKTAWKRADSHLSAARCVGGLAIAQTHSLKTGTTANMTTFYAKPDRWQERKKYQNACDSKTIPDLKRHTDFRNLTSPKSDIATDWHKQTDQKFCDKKSNRWREPARTCHEANRSEEPCQSDLNKKTTC